MEKPEIPIDPRCGQVNQPGCPPQPANGLAYTPEEAMRLIWAAYAEGVAYTDAGHAQTVESLLKTIEAQRKHLDDLGVTGPE